MTRQLSPIVFPLTFTSGVIVFTLTGEWLHDVYIGCLVANFSGIV